MESLRNVPSINRHQLIGNKNEYIKREYFKRLLEAGFQQLYKHNLSSLICRPQMKDNLRQINFLKRRNKAKCLYNVVAKTEYECELYKATNMM